MNTLLSLSIPKNGGGENQIAVPSYIPTGGFELGGTAHKVVTLGVQLFFVGAILFALFSLVYAGYLYLMSEGDKASVEAARQRIIYTLIGLTIVFLAIFVVNFVGGFFGIELLRGQDTYIPE